MLDRHVGIDVNGLADRAAQLDWPSGQAERTTAIARPVVVAPISAHQPILAGEAALLHPACRGWQRPRWTNLDAQRWPVADLIAAIAAGSEKDAPRLLGAHLRHMAERAERVALAVPDDFSTDAQAQLIDAVRDAGRYDPHEGWRPLTALLLWRSVGAVFGWARTLSAEEIIALRGRAVFVVSLLADRLLVSSLTLDVETEYTDAGALVTPVRSKAGKSYGDRYSPIDVERYLIEASDVPSLRSQLSSIGAGYDYSLGRVPDSLLQDQDGRWMPIPPAPRLSAARRLEAEKALHGLIERVGIQEELQNGFVLVETPDAERGFEDVSWQEITVASIRKLLNLSETDPGVAALDPDAVAVGCAEYAARLEHGLPTFFDYLPQIEISALDTDQENFAFIPLLKAERVAGNQPFRQSLPGRFEVHAGHNRITFYLSKGDERSVRKSVVMLPFAPERAVPIRLDVEQRPVNGYAVIDVVPAEIGALGQSRISVDWRRMEDTGKTAEQILDELGAARPRAYPNCAPTHTHASVWGALDLPAVIEQFLETPSSVLSRSYRENLRELRSKIGRRINPARAGVPGGVDEYLRPFSSDGKAPEDGLGVGLFGVGELSAMLRAKVDKDLGDLLTRRSSVEAEKLCGDLLMAGSWMFSGAPNAVTGFFRGVAAGKEPVGRRMEALSRVLSKPDDIEAAFRFIEQSLLRRRSSKPPWSRAMHDLKSIALLLEYNDPAYGIITTPQAGLVLECALGTLSLELAAGRGNGLLQHKFLWAIKSILLVLRHRKANSSFICPPENGGVGSAQYERTLSMLRAAQAQTRKPIRRASQIAQDAVENAIQFLQKTGGNPDIIRAISASLDDSDG